MKIRSFSAEARRLVKLAEDECGQEIPYDFLWEIVEDYDADFDMFEEIVNIMEYETELFIDFVNEQKGE